MVDVLDPFRPLYQSFFPRFEALVVSVMGRMSEGQADDPLVLNKQLLGGSQVFVAVMKSYVCVTIINTTYNCIWLRY